MTKTLTEQWKKGELSSGWYFYKTKLGGIVIGFQFYGLKYPYNACHQTIDNAKEVLAPVSDYDKYKQLVSNSDELVQKLHILENRLEIATKALNNVYHDMKCWTFISRRDERVLSAICEALKEMEGVK